MREAAELAESTQILMNVSEFTNIDDATNSLISSIQAFKYTAKESMDVVDILNTIGNNYAISTSDLAKSLTKSSGSLVAANGTLEEAVALTAAANTIIQDADVVGTALKTVAMRLRGTSVKELEEEGLDTDGAVESKSKLRSQIKSLAGVDIMTDTGAYKSTYEILSEIANVWENISDVDQAALLELLAGKRAGSVMSAILQNPDILADAFESANNAAGSAMRENEKYLDSIQGRIDLFNNALQTMWSNTLDSDLVKGFVNLATQLVKIIDKIGLVKSTLIALATYSMVKHKMGPITFFKNIIEASTQGITKLNKYATGLKNVTFKTNELLQAKTTLTQQQLKEKLTHVGLTDSVAEEIVAKTNLGKATDELSASTLDATLREAGYSQEKREAIIQSVFDTQAAKENTQANNENAVSSTAAGAAKDKDTQDTRENTIVKHQNTQAAKENTQANNENAVSSVNAGQRLKNLGNSLKGFVKQNLSTFIMLGTTLAISLLNKVVDGLVETMDEVDEKFDEAVNELNSLNSELKNLESQLEDVNEKISELTSNTPLSFTDQEELSRLQAQSAELQRQIDLTETLQKQASTKVNDAAMDAAVKYENINVKTGNTTAEDVGNTVKTVGGAGLAITGMAAASAATTMATVGAANAWNPVGWIALAAAAITLIAAGVTAIVAESEGQIGDSLDNMKEQHDKLQADFNKARAEYQNDPSEKNKKKFEEAQEALQSYEATMSQYLLDMNAYYSQMDWETATKEQRQAMREFYDTQDAWAIESGGANAKSNALERIFGKEAEGGFKKAQKEIDKLKENLTKAKESGDELAIAEALAKLEDFKLEGILSDEEIARLRDMGIYLYEAEDYFKTVVELESEFVDNKLEDVARDINKITEGLGALKSAFEEVIDKGVLTAATLMGLKDTLGINNSSPEELTSAWLDYLDVMMSGTASTEEMTEATAALAEEIINTALVATGSDALTAENKYIYLAQLRELGVQNADEYINDALQKKMTQEIEEELGDSTNIDKNAVKSEYLKRNGRDSSSQRYWASLDDDQIKALAEEYGILGDISDDLKETLMDRYDVEEDLIDAVIAKLKEKRELQTQISDIEKQQTDYLTWRNGDGENLGIKALEQDLKQYEDFAAKFNSFSDIQKQFNASDWTPGKQHAFYTNDVTGEKLTEQQYTARKNAAKEYQDWARINKDKLSAYLQLKKQYDELWQEGIDKGYIIDGEIISLDFKAQIEDIEDEIKGIDEEIDKNITLDVDLELELEDASERVDKIQEVFDTLQDAQAEYNEKGYVSVDTMQSLLQLEPKYLDLLVDESGNLNLTEQSLLNVARARITDLGLKQQSAILDQALALATQGSSQAILDQISVMETATAVGENWIQTQLNAISVALDQRVLNEELTRTQADEFLKNTLSQIQAVQAVTQSTLDNLANSLSSSGNTDTEEINDAFQKAMDYWDNRIEANEAKYEQIQNDIDWLEKQGKIADASYYQDQINLINQGEESKLQLLTNKLNKARDRMEELEAIGEEGSDAWWEAASIYNQTLSELDDVRDTVIELQDAIGEVDWSKFEEFNTRLDDINGKLETMRNLIAPNGEEDWFDDEGNWTEKGVAVLGSYIQAYTNSKKGLEEANVKLAAFTEKDYTAANKSWFASNYGIHSEQEYYDYLKKLTDEQYNYAEAVSDSQQDVADMYKSSIDAAEEYINTLIEGYQDYIDSVKESLDAERDLYSFKKNVKKQTKDIAVLERRIAALSGSNNAADIAERRRLEAQLAEQREELNDTYYEHSMDAQQEALDKEAEAYEEAMNKFVENLRANLDSALDNMETFMSGVTAAVTANAPIIVDAYESLGIALDSAIITPWEEAADAMVEYSEEDGLGLMNSWVASGGIFDTFATEATEYLTSIWSGVDAANAFADKVESVMTGIKNSIKSNVEEAKGYLSDVNNIKDSDNQPEGKRETPYDSSDGCSMSGADVKKLQQVLNTVFGEELSVNGVYGTATTAAVRRAQGTIGAGVDGYYGPNTKAKMAEYIQQWTPASGSSSMIGQGREQMLKLLPTSYYAKGTLGTSRDEWAITDELGDELVLMPGTNGNLSFMRKGTGVVPADLTANLMEWGKLNPNMMKLGGGANINMISNAVNKPELSFAFDSLVHVDNCSQDTLKDLEKMVDNKINQFSKQMNYALKRVGGR